MSIMVDTSALLPIVATQDQRHDDARAFWESLVASGEHVVCTSYGLLERYALAQARLGLDAVRAIRDDIRPALSIAWVTEEIHDAGVAAVLAHGRRQLSLWTVSASR